MLSKLNDYDWREAFNFASFSREDVVNIIAMKEGMNDEEPWVGVFELNDGTFACLSAGCDYTGWD